MPRSSKKPANRSEFAKIALIERVLGPSARAPGVEVGIGDDAAVLAGSAKLVWTVDAQVEGVHFRRELLSLEDVGFRSFQAALSDVAAMGAEPLGALANLVLPPRLSDRELARLVRGQAQAARESGCALIGGNLARGSELALTTTVLGRVKRPLLRSGARVGDELWLFGEVGAAALGLKLLLAGTRPNRAGRLCIERWRRPEALVAVGRRLTGRAHAAIDVSDGLAGDAAHLARASGVAVVIDSALLERSLPAHLVRAAAELGESALTLALNGGEDYALLAAGPASRRPRGAKPIGAIVAGRGVKLESNGRRAALRGGFQHFR